MKDGKNQETYNFGQIDIFLKKSSKLFHKSKYALTIWHSFLKWSNKFYREQTSIFMSI